MNKNWTISGETGAAWGCERKSLEAWGIDSASLRHASFAADTFQFHIRPGFPRPDLDQSISLFQGEVRMFCGKILSRPIRYSRDSSMGTSVTAYGPLDWMSKTTATSLMADDKGVIAERAMVKTQAGVSLDVSLNLLIDAARAVGAQISRGSVDAAFPVTPMTFSSASWLSAIADACLWIPDSASRVRYNVDGFPAMDILRRTNADNWLTLDSAHDDIQDINLDPKPDLVPGQIILNSAAISSDGSLSWSQAVAGDPAAFRRQVVTVSGPEKASWVPSFQPDSVVLKTYPAATQLQTVLNLKSSELVAINAQCSTTHYLIQTATATGVRFNGSGYDVTTIPTLATWKIDGVVQTDFTSGLPTALLPHLVTSGNVPDWWKETGYKTQKVEITIRHTVAFPYDDAHGGLWHSACSACAAFTYNFGTGIAYFADLTIQVDAIDLSADGVTPVYRPRDIGFVFPPSDLAGNLLSAQAWMPYAGSVTLGPNMPWRLWTGSPLNIRGVPDAADLATAGALVQEQSYDLVSGLMTLTLGFPPRNPFGSLITRFRSSAQENILPQ